MSGPLDLRQRFALARYLTDLLKAMRADTLLPEAAGQFTPGERLSARFGGRTAAWITVPNPEGAAKITDEAKLLAWVQENRPGEVEMVPVIRESFLNALKRSVADCGGLPTVDGEVTPVPGMEKVPGDTTPRVTLAPGAGEIILAAAQAGEFQMGDLLALPGAEQEGGEDG